MRGIWKWGAVAAVSVAVLAVVAVAYIYLASQQIIGRTYPLPSSHIHASTDPKVIAVGQHLVRPYGCADCHRPNLQGTYIADFGISSRNLTRLVTTFSDADFDRAIRKGLRRGGPSTAGTKPADAVPKNPENDGPALGFVIP